MTLKQTLGVLDSLEDCGDSRTKKLEILNQFKDNVILAEMFRLTYNVQVSFGFRGDPKFEPINPAPEVKGSNWGVFLDFLDQLGQRDLTGTAAHDAWVDLCGHLSHREWKWFIRVLNRDLRVGVQGSTLALVWPTLLPEYGCQLAHKFERGKIQMHDPTKREPWRTLPAYLEPKLDGMRLRVHVTAGKARALSREGLWQGNLQPVLDAQEGAFQAYPDCVLDCEVFYQSWNETMPRITTKVMPLEERQKLVFWCFDFLPFAGEDQPLYKRKGNLRTWLENFPIPQFVFLEHEVVDSEEGATKIYTKWLEEGYQGHTVEGAMLKYVDAPYVNKRTRAWLKYKPVDTLDGQIISCYEGKPGTQYEGMLGGFMARTANGNEFGIGSGLTDVNRKEFWEQRDTMVGKIIEFEMQADKKAVAVVRNPVFKRIRDDRTSL